MVTHGTDPTRRDIQGQAGTGEHHAVEVRERKLQWGYQARLEIKWVPVQGRQGPKRS